MSATLRAARCRLANLSGVVVRGWHPLNRRSGTRFAVRSLSR